jgi:Mg2+/citrate symporter
MIHFEFALIKGFCVGLTIDEVDEVETIELRMFFLILYVGIIFDNG